MPKSFSPESKFFHKKQLGQNFLSDPHILGKIISVCDLKQDEFILEIGPGRGVLTERIAPQVRKLIAIEKDHRLIPILKEKFIGRNVELKEGDFLEYPWEALCAPVKLIGNIPYYITTPIIEKIIEYKNIFPSAFLMVQWEYAQRLKAQVRTKEYGSLTCFLRYYADLEVLFKIKKNCFTPAPKVDSAFIKIIFLPQPRIQVKDEKLLFTVIQKSFQQRRKMILNALPGDKSKQEMIEFFSAVKISSKARPEELTLEDFGKIADELTRRGYFGRASL
jgi:16S rRNA (adenine1518-N6/adenine1519-N6)-dimethyltransferase